MKYVSDVHIPIAILRSEQVDHQPVGEGLSTWGATFMLTNNMIGIGMLALPFALKQAGLLFVAAFIVVAVIMSSTLLLIGHLLELVDGEAAAMGIPRVLCFFF